MKCRPSWTVKEIPSAPWIGGDARARGRGTATAPAPAWRPPLLRARLADTLASGILSSYLRLCKRLRRGRCCPCAASWVAIAGRFLPAASSCSSASSGQPAAWAMRTSPSLPLGKYPSPATVQELRLSERYLSSECCLWRSLWL
ncbi:hypothetical protein SEVIR_5G381100v4 [Setaria viridis]|uniref:Uncharacterized protein n=2 Tax=Setaria TaxID=4554 RepID=A0A368RD21_SETIT|nr:hypothetical protein SETIT_5G375900v2 [Setaria italica]TKW17634.1 hypothetical protein SEVIR_5G381100v2 [Setaria viridis]